MRRYAVRYVEDNKENHTGRSAFIFHRDNQVNYMTLEDKTITQREITKPEDWHTIATNWVDKGILPDETKT